MESAASTVFRNRTVAEFLEEETGSYSWMKNKANKCVTAGKRKSDWSGRVAVLKERLGGPDGLLQRASVRISAASSCSGLHLHQVPPDFHEPFIFSGYRSHNIGPYHSLKSAFLERNNEAINVWTHFIPSVYFLWHFWGHLGLEADAQHSSFLVPWRLYLLTLVVYPLLSSLAHALNNMSLQARHICFFIDYVGCSWYTVGVAAMYHAYSFPGQGLGGRWDGLFVWIAGFNALASTFIACHSRFMPPGAVRKAVRLLSFAVPYIYDNLPLFYRFVYGDPVGEPLHMAGQGRLFVMSFQLTLMAVFFYGLHFPERCMPGRFDIIGHSHQFFHICSALASSYQMEAAFLDLQSRRNILQTPEHLANMAWSPWIVWTVLVVNVIVAAFYSVKILRQKPVMNAKTESICAL